MSRDTLICLGLACLTILLYAPVRSYSFVNFDDPGYVGTPQVQSGLTADSVRWAMTTRVVGNWHPLTVLSHMLDVTLFGGRKENAGGHHLMSVAIHALNAVVLYLLLRTATKQFGASLAVAAIWAVHPLRVESVAWVAERKDVLSTMFFLLSLWAYVAYSRRARWATYFASLACAALGLMCKPMLVTLPCVLLLLDLWPLQRTVPWRRLIIEKLPFFALALTAAAVAIVMQRRGGAMTPGEQIAIPLRVANAFAAFAAYLKLTVWPAGLAVFYPYEGAIPGTHLSPLRVAAGAILLVAGTLTGVVFWRRERAILIGWLWFLGTLVPVIGLVQVGRQSMADRYTYIPHIGLLIGVVWALKSAAAGRLKVPRPALVIVTAAVVLALSVRTFDQLRYWRDSETLWTHALDVTRHNHLAHAMLAFELGNRGDVNGAVEHYQRSIQILPDEPQTYYNIGQLYLVTRAYPQAQEWLEKAIRLDPNYADAHGNLAKTFSAQGRTDEAIAHFREVVRIRPESYLAHYDLAVELAEHGQTDAALDEFAEAVRLNPDSPQVRYSQSLTLARAGRGEDANTAYKTYLDLARRRGIDPLPMPATNPHNP